MILRLVPVAIAGDHPTGLLYFDTNPMACAIGRGGVRSDKREGDGATPCGSFPLRHVFYRPDRGPRPKTALPVKALAESDGWCDAPEDPAYNTQVRLPYAGRSEQLWREDGLYDLIVVIGYNDDPVVPGAGSAIFMHVAAPGLAPTEGCVALDKPELMRLLASLGPGDRIEILDLGQPVG
jgi:L,D-peptidoglycan transpeptidase YkuD (ErfK/YbiS/YcfS/YnhG family)